MSGPCSIGGCIRPALYKGWCSPHYGRWRRFGDPLHPVHEHNRGLGARFWDRVDQSGDCWEWTGGRLAKGYGRLDESDGNGGRRNLSAHRVSWELANGPIPAGLLVCHRCDNPPCVRPDHLFLGTHEENAQDRQNKGRGQKVSYLPDLKGESNPRAKADESLVRQIRNDAASGCSLKRLADEHGFTVEGIRAIVKRKTWKHVA